MRIVFKERENDESFIYTEMIEEIEEYEFIKKTYIIHDKDLSELYANQYRDSTFIFTGDMDEEIEADIMIIVASNFDKKNADNEYISNVLDCIKNVKTNNIYGITWQRLINNKDSALWKSINENNLTFKQIIILQVHIVAIYIIILIFFYINYYNFR